MFSGKGSNVITSTYAAIKRSISIDWHKSRMANGSRPYDSTESANDFVESQRKELGRKMREQGWEALGVTRVELLELAHQSGSDPEYHATLIPKDKDGNVVVFHHDQRQSRSGKVHVKMDDPNKK